jgi:hypothetical protein
MKLIKIKPRLVDPEWLSKKPKNPMRLLKPPIKVIKDPHLASSSSNDMSFYFNIIGFIILCIGGFLLYNRLYSKEKDELDKQTRILNFNQYVQDNVER